MIGCMCLTLLGLCMAWHAPPGTAGKQASSTRQRVLRWLLELLPKLEPGQLAQHVPAVFQAALYHGKNEENATPR
jgi:hypothetical protein